MLDSPPTRLSRCPWLGIAPEAIRADYGGLTTDVSGKWTSKLNDNKTTIELVGGWHRAKYDQDALDDSVLDTPTTRIFLSNLSRFSRAGNEDVSVQQGCNDSNNMQVDPYPLIKNCPVFEYWLDSPGSSICGYDENDLGGSTVRNCEFLDKNEVVGRTLNWSAFLQDSWQPKPNITINAGVRYEEQRLRYAKHLQNTIDPFSQQRLGKNALTLKDMWAPRFGADYDWTKEGRSKAYASFGRFFESIPMATCITAARPPSHREPKRNTWMRPSWARSTKSSRTCASASPTRIGD